MEFLISSSNLRAERRKTSREKVMGIADDRDYLPRTSGQPGHVPQQWIRPYPNRPFQEQAPIDIVAHRQMTPQQGGGNDGGGGQQL